MASTHDIEDAIATKLIYVDSAMKRSDVFVTEVVKYNLTDEQKESLYLKLIQRPAIHAMQARQLQQTGCLPGFNIPIRCVTQACFDNIQI